MFFGIRKACCNQGVQFAKTNTRPKKLSKLQTRFCNPVGFMRTSVRILITIDKYWYILKSADFELSDVKINEEFKISRNIK